MLSAHGLCRTCTAARVCAPMGSRCTCMVAIARPPSRTGVHRAPRAATPTHITRLQDDGAAAASAAPADAELLSGDALEGDELATKTGQLDVMLEYLWQVHGVDFYSGGGGELSVGLYRSVKERLMRTPPDVEFRAVRIQKPQSGNLVDDKRRAAPPLACVCDFAAVDASPLVRAVWCVRAGEQVTEEFHHNVSKPWIERLKRVDADTQKALDLDATVRPTLHAWPASAMQRTGDRACMRPFIAARELRSLAARVNCGLWLQAAVLCQH